MSSMSPCDSGLTCTYLAASMAHGDGFRLPIQEALVTTAEKRNILGFSYLAALA